MKFFLRLLALFCKHSLWIFRNSIGEAPLWISVCRSERNRMWLTLWSRVLEELRVPQQVKKFPTYYVTRMFSTAFTTAHNLFLYWARWTQTKTSPSLCQTQFNTVLPSTPRSTRCPLLKLPPTEILGEPQLLPTRVTWPCYLVLVSLP
jgi:hypothetical protein